MIDCDFYLGFLFLIADARDTSLLIFVLLACNLYVWQGLRLCMGTLASYILIFRLVICMFGNICTATHLECISFSSCGNLGFVDGVVM